MGKATVFDYLQVGELREGLFTAGMDTSVRPVTCVDPETEHRRKGGTFDPCQWAHS